MYEGLAHLDKYVDIERVDVKFQMPPGYFIRDYKAYEHALACSRHCFLDIGYDGDNQLITFMRNDDNPEEIRVFCRDLLVEHLFPQRDV